MKLTLEVHITADVPSLSILSEAIERSFTEFGRNNRGTRGNLQAGDQAWIRRENGVIVGFWKVEDDPAF